MIPIYYQSSEGVIINLIQEPYMMLSDTDLLNNKWTPITAGTNNPKMAKLKKELESPPFSIVVTGANKGEMLSNLEHIESVFDRDCFLFETTKQMGRLYIGEFYRECLITTSNKEKVFEKTYTTVGYVATSNDGYWKNDKTVEFSGAGNLVGEIAYSLYPTARVNDSSIEFYETEDKKAQIKYGAPFSYDNYLMFDIGNVIDVDSFSGLELKSEVGGTAISCDVQISDGTTVDDARSISATALEETTRINIIGFSNITVDDFGESGWSSPSLIMYGYINYERAEEIVIKSGDIDIVGQPIDVSEFDFVTFRVGYSSGTTTVEYTVDEEQWTTVDTISLVGGQETEVVIENVTCRYIRLLGAFFGSINSEISLISGEPIPNRNLMKLGYSTQNVELVRYEGDGIEYLLQDTGESYLTFDDTSLLLKKIECTFASGIVIVQGYSSGSWSDIVQLSSSMSQNYNTNYDKIRLKLPHALSNPQTAGLKIMVETDARVVNESYAPSDAIIEFNGAWNNPNVNIAGNDYGANIQLASGHKLIIDTAEKTVRDYEDDYTYENVFASRTETAFEKIETGENSVEWDASPRNIKITISQTRSTPKWN